MNEYSGMPDKFAALAALSSVSALLDEIGSPEWEVEETYAFVSRFKEVVSNVHSRLRLAGTSSITVDWIQAIEGNSQALIDLAQSLKDSAPALNLDLPSANIQLDALVDAAASLPAIPIRRTSQALEKALETFSQEVGSGKSEIATEVERLRSELATREEELQQLVNEHTALVNQLQQSIEQRANAATETFGAVESRTSESAERLEREITSIQETFRESQRVREQEFANSQNEYGRLFEERTQPQVEQVEQYLEQARSMLQEVAGASSAAHYAKQRDDQKLAANFWRMIGVISFGVLFFVAGGVFLDARFAEMEFSVSWLAARSGVLLSLAAFVTYTLRQSGQHRRREEQIDRVASELQLLWPFVNRLPEEDRLAVLLHVAPLYFKGGLPMGVEADSGIGVERIRNAITQAVQRRATIDEDGT